MKTLLLLVILFVSCSKDDETKLKLAQLENEKLQMQMQLQQNQKQAKAEIEKVKKEAEAEKPENKEANNPLHYIKFEYTLESPFLASRYIKIKMTNTAKYTTYKDFIFRVDYLAPSGTSIYNEPDRNWMNIIAPGETIITECKPRKSIDYSTVKVKIVGATVYNGEIPKRKAPATDFP